MGKGKSEAEIIAKLQKIAQRSNRPAAEILRDNYKKRLIRWAVDNPGGLWKDTDEARKARAWMQKNAPEDFASLYWNEDESVRKGIDKRFVPQSVRSERVERAVRRGMNEAAPKVAGTLAGAYGLAAGLSALPAVPGAIQHTMNVLANPASAKTTAGALGSLALDTYGLGYGADTLGKKAVKAINGDYTWQDVPETLLNLPVMLPGATVAMRGLAPQMIGAANTVENAFRMRPTFGQINSGAWKMSEKETIMNELRGLSDKKLALRKQDVKALTGEFGYPEWYESLIDKELANRGIQDWHTIAYSNDNALKGVSKPMSAASDYDIDKMLSPEDHFPTYGEYEKSLNAESNNKIKKVGHIDLSKFKDLTNDSTAINDEKDAIQNIVQFFESDIDDWMPAVYKSDLKAFLSSDKLENIEKDYPGIKHFAEKSLENLETTPNLVEGVDSFVEKQVSSAIPHIDETPQVDENVQKFLDKAKEFGDKHDLEGFLGLLDSKEAQAMTEYLPWEQKTTFSNAAANAGVPSIEAHYINNSYPFFNFKPGTDITMQAQEPGTYPRAFADWVNSHIEIPRTLQIREPNRELVQQLVQKSRSGEAAPLSLEAKDMFGHQFALPEEWAAAQQLPEYQKAYPGGADYFWRGNGQGKPVIFDDDYHAGYDSIFGGSLDMASGYNAGNFSGGRSTVTSLDGSYLPNTMLYAIPKGSVLNLGFFDGARWNRLHNLKPETMSVQAEINKLYSELNAAKMRGAQNVPELEARIRDLETGFADKPFKFDPTSLMKYNYKTLHDASMFDTSKSFYSTDDLATYIKHEAGEDRFPFQGVLLRGIHDGSASGLPQPEVIYNKFAGDKRVAPKLVTPHSTFLFDLTNGKPLAAGGKIHIKPSHRGRLTELKERTGKTEAELYNDGNPAHKKMVVFARNSRKWKHEDGGLLERLNSAYSGDREKALSAVRAVLKNEYGLGGYKDDDPNYIGPPIPEVLKVRRAAVDDAMDRIVAVENSKDNPNGGWDAEKQVWYPHDSAEGGAQTIGYGIKLSNGTPEAALAAKQGYLTDEQVNALTYSSVRRYHNNARKVYDKKYGEGEWDKLSAKQQSLLTDYEYNPGLRKFPSFMKAVRDNDKDGMLREYKRYLGKLELTGRNKRIKSEIDEMFSGQ